MPLNQSNIVWDGLPANGDINGGDIVWDDEPQAFVQPEGDKTGEDKKQVTVEPWYDGAKETLSNMGKVYPVAETMATLATSAYGIPASGVAGLLAMAKDEPGGESGVIKNIDTRLAAGQRAMEAIQKSLIYTPQTEGGKQLTEATMYPFEKIDEAAKYAGSKIDNPNIAAAVDTGINVAGMVALGKTAKGQSPIPVKAVADAVQLTKPGKYLFDTLPKRLYASSMKMPLSKKWTKDLPGKDINQRTRATEEGLRSAVTNSEYGKEKAKRLEQEVKNVVDKTVKNMAKIPEMVVQRESIIKPLIKKASRELRSDTAIKTVELIDEYIKNNYGDTLNPVQMNSLKRKLWGQVGKWTGEGKEIISDQVIMNVGSQMRARLEQWEPSLKELNQTDAARINLHEAINTSLERIKNTNLGPLGFKMLLRPHMIPFAIWDITLGDPTLKSALAIALAKANPSKYGKIVKPKVPDIIPSLKRSDVTEPVEGFTVDPYEYSKQQPIFPDTPKQYPEAPVKKYMPVDERQKMANAEMQATTPMRSDQIPPVRGESRQDNMLRNDMVLSDDAAKNARFVAEERPLPPSQYPEAPIKPQIDIPSRRNMLDAPAKTGYNASLTPEQRSRAVSGNMLKTEAEIRAELMAEDAKIAAGKAKPVEPVKIISEPDGGKTVKTQMPKAKAEGLTPPQQKKYLMAEIETALKTAKEIEPADNYDILKGMDKKSTGYGRVKDLTDALKEKYGTVIIEVPGDGEFTIINTKKHIATFRDKAKSFPTSMPKSGHSKPGSKSTPPAKRITGDVEYYNEYKPRTVTKYEPPSKYDVMPLYENGYYSNNQYLIKTKSKPDVGRQYQQGRADAVDGLIIEAAKAKAPAKIAGEFTYNNGQGVGAHFVSGDKESFVPAKYVDHILTEHPTAQPFIGNTGMTSVVFKTNDRKVVGVIPKLLDEDGKLLTDYVKKRMKEIKR